MSDFVLIHGSWHGGWCWDRVGPLLTARGHRVWAPTLVGLGELATEATPETGLHTHVDQIVALVRAHKLADVVLVGHSYGGLVIDGVADRLPEQVSHLVYLDALVADHGQSAFDLMPGVQAGFEASMRASGSDFLIPPMDPRQFGVTDSDDLAWVTGRLTGMPIRTHSEKLDAPRGADRSIPSTYVHCLRFGLGESFADQARQAGWNVVELDTGHDVMITHPAELAAVLLGGHDD